MGGEKCVAIGSDLRFGVQMQTMATNYQKLMQVRVVFSVESTHDTFVHILRTRQARTLETALSTHTAYLLSHDRANNRFFPMLNDCLRTTDDPCFCGGHV